MQRRTMGKHAGRDWPASVWCAGLLVVMGGAMVISACGKSGSDALDPYLCTLDDLGGGYQQLTDGNFSPRDLADLGRDANAHEREFREAGMKRGRFVFFKQGLPKPPFEPPLNVVCEVIEFGSEEQAQTWLEGPRPTGNVADAAIAWVPEDHREVREKDSLAGTRTFEVKAGEDAERVAAVLQFSRSGALVVAVAVGKTADAITDDERRILGELIARRANRLGEVAP
jgi:hypothetical protein